MINKRSLSTMIGGAVVGVVAATALAFAASGAVAQSAPPVPAKTITVSGEGKVTVKPDMATINLGAQATASTASEALAQMNESMTKLIDALKAAGIAEDDIATSSLYLSPNWDQSSHITGFTASNSVSVKVRDLTKAGSVIDTAATAAGNNATVSGISFSVADPEKVIGEARAAAIANAKKRAGEFATAAGGSVGDVLQISEVGVNVPMPLTYEAAASDRAAGGVAVMPGTQDMTVNVTVVFALG